MRKQWVYTLCAMLVIAAAGCQKYVDKPGKHDIRLDSNFYCNNPSAVNYNWNFPGTPDSTTCIYPSDIFAGHYLFTDSVYNGDGITLTAQVPLSLNVYALSRSQLALTGFCGSTDSIKLTANRTFHAQVDTTIMNGQPLCRIVDTLSGFVTGNLTGILQFSFTVVSDTGTSFHHGTAIRQ